MAFVVRRWNDYAQNSHPSRWESQECKFCRLEAITTCRLFAVQLSPESFTFRPLQRRNEETGGVSLSPTAIWPWGKSMESRQAQSPAHLCCRHLWISWKSSAAMAGFRLSGRDCLCYPQPTSSSLFCHLSCGHPSQSSFCSITFLCFPLSFLSRLFPINWPHRKTLKSNLLSATSPSDTYWNDRCVFVIGVLCLFGRYDWRSRSCWPPLRAMGSIFSLVIRGCLNKTESYLSPVKVWYFQELMCLHSHFFIIFVCWIKQ